MRPGSTPPESLHPEATPELDERSVAVVGMSGRFPGAADVDAFWENLKHGVEAITRFSQDELRSAGVDDAELTEETYVKARGVLSDIEWFDAGFFGLSTREAQILDPQHRALLECAHQALEHAGYDPTRFDGLIGVYAGSGFNTYLLKHLVPHPQLIAAVGEYQVMLGNDKDFLPSRISYSLDLKGPSFTVQAGCSTSLVAAHLGCMSLINYDCDLALAGGVSINLPQVRGYRFKEGGIFSPDGHCQPFGPHARGTVPGSGAGLVVLKRLQEAYDDGDTIYAVIRGSAVNNDGSDKLGFTAPGPRAQTEAIIAAQEVAAVAPETIGYLESHGTGTAIGDPIELQSLTQAFRAGTEARRFCALGALKSSIGHPDTAAGIASLIKTALALHHRQIPPSVAGHSPGDQDHLAETPFYLTPDLHDWPAPDAAPRRAGISAFGIGGTNVHAILEEAPPQRPGTAPRPAQLLVLSARSAAALDSATRRIGRHLRQQPAIELADVAHTLQVGRRAYEFRRALVAGDTAQVLEGLETSRFFDGDPGAGPPEIAFLIPGQGTQYAGMGRSLYACESVYRQAVDRCTATLQAEIGLDLRTLLHPAEGQESAASELLEQTRYAQPALFTVAYALAEQWRSWGIEPAAVLGHSLGEYVAACLAGVFSLTDALELVATRGRLVQQLPRGGMLAIALSEAELRPQLVAGASLVALNGPRLCTVAGTLEVIEELEAKLRGRGVEIRRLHTSHAFHSPVMDPILSEYGDEVAKRSLHPARLPIVSNVSGDWAQPDELATPDYWVEQLRRPVRFADGIRRLLAEPRRFFVEVGPGNTLGRIAHSQLAAPSSRIASSLGGPRDRTADFDHLLESLGRLWTHGAEVDWQGYRGDARRRRIALPTYPFERRRLWVDPELGPLPIEDQTKRPAEKPAARAAPRNNLEQQLADLWEGVLGTPPTLEDDFFELGGHSLLASQLLSRIHDSLNVQLEVRALFEAPTLAGLAAAVAAKLEARDVPPPPPIAPLPRARPLPLSAAQQRLWFLDQLLPGNPAYNMALALRLTGALRPAALHAAIDHLVARHEILRTAIVAGDAGPRQQPLPARRQPLPIVDLGHLTGARREALARRLAMERRDSTFDLASGEVLRCLLIRLAESDHLVVFATHHIVLDGSQELFVERLTTAYRAATSGDSMAPVAVDYADYAQWEQSWLESEAVEQQLAFWRDRLGNESPPVLELPTDRPRPAIRSWRGDSVEFHLAEGLRQQLKAVCQERGATLYMTLLAALQTLLYRLTEQRSIWIGSPMINRPIPAQGVLGCFMNTVVLAATVNAKLAFEQLIDTTRRDALDAFSHREVPFERLVQALQPDRDLARTPLFQVMFTAMDLSLSRPRLELSDLEVDFPTLPSSHARFDLLTSLTEGLGEGLAGFIEFDAEIFDSTTIERFASAYRTLLTAVAERPATPLGELPLLGPAERHQLVAEWNDTATGTASVPRLESLFEAQASRRPDAMALECDGAALSYGELARRASALADRLAGQGVTAETPVAVFLERSPTMVIALLGILEAGGAYVPLSLGDPPARRQSIIETLGIRHLTTDSRTATAHGEGLRQQGLEHIVRVDRVGEAVTAPRRARGDDRSLAYTLFTSGSTGTPKGVMVRHRPASRLIRWVNDTFSVGSDDRILFLTSLGFDLSVYDVFGLLAAGGTVRIVSDQDLRDPSRQLATLGRERVTFWDSAPAALQQLMPLIAAGEVVSHYLRRIFLSGDWIPVALPEPLSSAFPSADLISLGGATEATVWSNFFPVERVDPQWISIPYGEPITDARYHVLDSRREPCPVGVPGDLFIGGACLASGYAARPELTAASFQPDGLTDRPGQRLYRTGDRARYWADGTLEFLGRLDQQVKIRGFRIELGEIETVLAQHETVRAAVVLARQDPPSAKRLVAYVVGRHGTPDEAVLAEHLRRHLPEYMVPTAWVALAELPLTANGKLDRQALPAPRTPEEDPGEVALSPMEDLAAGLWRDLLSVRRIAPGDDFFELGGDSLLVTRLISRVRESLAAEIEVRQLFEAPTLAGFAATLEAALDLEAAPAAPPIERVPDAEPALSFAQERLWFLDQLQPESSAYNIGAAVRIHGRLEADHLAAALVDLCQRHEPLRTTIHTNGSELRQQIADTAGDLLRVVDLRAIGGPGAAAEQHAIGRAEVERPFDLADGSPLRVTLLRLEAEQHLAFFTLHHIAGDGWSMGILLEELAALYRSRVAGRPAALPRLPVRYSDFAAWQRRWLSGEVLERQLAYWRQALAGAPTVLELPADRPRPPLAQYRGATYGVALDADVSRQLRQLSQTHGLTLFMTLLTAFKVLLLRHTRQRDVVVGSPIAGRNRTEIEGLIGLFVNSLVLRTDLQRNPSFGTALQRVRRTALGAYAHQDLPFERLVDELRIERDLSHSPLFQALFQLQPNPLARLELPGLTLVPVDLEVRAAKLDLVLSLEEDGEEIRGLWRFNTDLFDPPTIARLSARLQTLVAGCLAQPENRIEDLPLLSAAEHAQLVGEWNDTDRAYPAGPLFPDGFAALVARHPEHIAIVFEGQALSYGELARQVERVTRHLRQRGCGPESRVAVCIERCPELVIALLAILEAGGAYVPLDPAYPAERLAFMLADSGAQAVLSLRRHADLLPAESVPRLWLDERVGAAALGGEIGQPHRPVAPSHPAYVLYTSGSTGRPKGVIVSHGAIANRLLWMQDHYRLRADDRVLQKTPVSFDVSVWEFFWPLCSGAQLVLARPDGHGDGAYLTRLIADERITFLHFVPSMLQAFLEASNLAATRSLRRVIASGEALGPDLAQRFYRCVGGSLDNLYGPTEAAVDVTYHPTTAAGDKTSVPIGRPIANTRIHLLDRRMRPTPIGVSAELLIGGVNLARGYLGRPALTAERFVPDPLARLAGERLYRTGDLARHRADGAISYLGRLDNQVKLRGFRIELGEIEAVLAQDPTLREAAVVVGRQGRGNEQLVAYVVARDGAAVGAADLRRRLALRLPDYMVPARIIELEELPLAPNGKLDRRGLPAPDEARADLARTFVAPRNALEQELAECWQELLCAERIGVEDDFFELGGNSIVAAIFVNRLQEKLGRIIHVVALFDAPTVAAFADYMRDRYPEAVAETWGEEVPPAARIAAPRQRIDAASLEELRRLIPAAGPLPEAPAANPRAVFVLSPPRSGSTLLRVMLAGHSRLFAPPELELLSFATLVERQTALTGRYSMWLEGVLRAIMEARRTDAGEARQLMDELVSRGLTTQQFYGRLQSWIGDRILVDKTSTYALDVAVLERAEAMFRDAVYIHLLRHPCGMIRSFEEAQLDEIFLRQEHRFDPRQLAELVWAASHQNIRQFLPRIPASRQVAIAFEDLVRAPQATLERLCQALDLPFEPAMLQPYAAESGRMSDGLHTESRMLGDVKFHQHRTIDPAVADRWRGEMSEDSLGDPTLRVAASLGYGDPAELTTIEPLAGDSTPPLSFAQERLWFLDRLAPGSVTYNIPVALHIEGALRPALLEQSLGAVIRRHATLRTTFPTVAGQPVPVVSHDWRLVLPVVDCQALPPRRADAAAHRLATALGRLPFDLERGPLLRLALLRLAEDHHRLVLVIHHIAADGWSMGLLLSEMTAHYEALASGKPAPLPELTLQYGDFAAWQRRWLDGGVSSSQLAYWRSQLAAVPNLHLPTDRPRPAVASGRGATFRTRWRAAHGDALRALAQERSASLFMVLLAGFEALIGRYSGQTDFAIGTPLAGRNRSEIENLIGLFVNTVAIRSDLARAQTFAQLVDSMRRRVLTAFSHQELPFERLVDELQPERDLAYSPIFQVLFVLQNAATAAAPPAGLEFEPVDLSTATAKFDLNLLLGEDGRDVLAYLEYATDLFDATTARRISEHFEQLLRAACADSEGRLSDLPLLSSGQRQQILLEWNDTGPAVSPSAEGLHHLFSQQALSVPDRIALIAVEERLSYRELDRRSSIVADELRRRGVGPEVRVAVACRRGPDLVVGMLAVLRAGGAYVPLDLEYPAERLAFILADAQASLVLVDEARPPALRDDPTPILALRRDWRSASAPATDPVPTAPIDPDHLSYVIYTSGSTGRPKGVAISHRSPLALVEWSKEVFGPARIDGVMASTSICFDLSVFELFVPLCRGGKVVLAADALELPSHPAADEVTLLNTVPSAITEVLRFGPLPAALRTINLAGEPLQRTLVEAIYDRPGVEAVYNLYGPSEDTTYSTYARIPGRIAAAPTIGRPVGETTAHVLDRDLQQVPQGAIGELLLAGSGVARGYLARPALTAERFVPDPTSGAVGARAYRTGDQVRYLTDGELEFLGRVDHQVKVRGFRIELGEIEARLRAHREVREAVVLAREDNPGDVRLVAYVVAEKAPEPAAAELAGFLAESLPSFQIPAHFVTLPALPLTPNGKVDRRALPAPAGRPTAEDEQAEHRSTPIEEVLEGVWSQVLQISPIRPDENFFDLGGHSLLATQVVSRVREIFAVDLPLRALFQYPTLSQLAAEIDRSSRSLLTAAEPEASAAEGPAPLSFAQERLWFFEQLVPGTAIYNMASVTRLDGRLDTAALRNSLDAVVARHDSLSCRFVLDDGQPAQVSEPGTRVPLTVIDLGSLTPNVDIAGDLARDENRRVFDLSRGPLLRALLLRLTPTEHLLLLTTHHIVCDGWSLTVLEHELMTLYGAFSRNLPSPLPALPLRYGDFARWQRRHLRGEVLQRQLDFWKEHLAGAPPYLEMPTDRPRPAQPDYRGAIHRFRLDRQTTEELQRLCREEGLTLFMALNTAFAMTLHRFSGELDLVIGSNIANRHRQSLEGLIGLLANTVALRFDLTADPTVRDLLATARDDALAAYEHQDLPFEKLVEELRIERHPGRNPLFQVMLILQNTPLAPVAGSGLEVTPIPPQVDVARFDLALFLVAEGGELRADLSYSSELFDLPTIEFLSDSFTQLAAALPRQLDAPVSALSIVDDEQQADLVGAFADDIEQ